MPRSLESLSWRALKRSAYFVLTALLLLAGCHEQTPNFVPSTIDASSALSKALERWQAGEAAGEIPGTTPTIFVTDTNRKPDQKLVTFRILGETPGLSGRTYAVELDLNNPTETLTAEFIVVGIDPLWVFRREDYELLMHWDHAMSEQYKNEKPK